MNLWKNDFQKQAFQLTRKRVNAFFALEKNKPITINHAFAQLLKLGYDELFLSLPVVLFGHSSTLFEYLKYQTMRLKRVKMVLNRYFFL